MVRAGLLALLGALVAAGIRAVATRYAGARAAHARFDRIDSRR